MAGIAIPVIHRDFCLPSSVRAFNDKGRLRHSTAYGRASTSDGYRWVYQAHKGYRWSVSATLVNQLRQYTGSAKNIRRLPISSQTSNRWVGSYPVTELNPEHIQHYYLEKSKTLAASTIVKHHHLLKQALSQAVEWRSLPRNVAEAVKPPRVARKEMRALSRPEVHRVLVLQRRVILQGNSWADFEAGNERVRVSHDERSVAEEEDLSVFSHNASL